MERILTTLDKIFLKSDTFLESVEIIDPEIFLFFHFKCLKTKKFGDQCLP